MGQDINEVHSELVTVDDLIKSNNRYNIPRYQRLYVWEDEQVDTLLQDLFEAYKAQKDLFYLGGILIVNKNGDENVYDLIDGQQRFTTLWLISLELNNCLINFTTVNKELRLMFSIREEAKAYFENALNTDGGTSNTISNDNESLLKIDRARGRIKKFIVQELNDDSIAKNDFATFIRSNVKLLISEVPKDTDLNKMFEVINNRGEQLQQHEILKATILSHIPNKQERIRYGKIWNACADMENYVEKSIQTEAGKNLSGAYDQYSLNFDLKKIFEIMTAQRSKVNKAMSLNAILDGKAVEFEEEKNEENAKYIDDHPEAQDDELQAVRSILSFPQLLLHVLRIYLFEHDKKDIQRINEKELLDFFKKHLKISEEKDAKDFISLLWEVRVCFDLFIIKWVKVENEEEIHLIKPLEKYNQYRKWTYYLRRKTNEENDGFALLQSMLYHSQQITTHYWLTPLLYKALYTRNKQQLYDYLRVLDNTLFCTAKQDTLPERTWDAMQIDLQIERPNYSFTLLNEQLGVSFPHYWFYKTEFILWYLLKDKKDQRIKGKEDLWKNFRLTAKNSVEHISPQNPNYKQDLVSNKYLNKYGNLALVSRSINSEFSNKPFREKRERFLYNNTSKLDSLKLALVFDNTVWNDTLCINHCTEIVGYFEEYFDKN
jgi:uncharacterized protein with ParB-like and HNH nuclease domain